MFCKNVNVKDWALNRLLFIYLQLINKKMKIAILGTRGIPNNYGGFEQCAEYLSIGLVEKGHQVTVYSPDFHPIKRKSIKEFG